MVQRYLSFAAGCGLSPTALCAAAGFRVDQVEAGDGEVPYLWLWRVRDQIIRQRPELPIGLQLGHYLCPIVDEVAESRGSIEPRATARDALRRIDRLVAPLHRGPGEGGRLTDHGDVVHWTLLHRPHEPSESAESLLVATMVTLRTLTRRRVAPCAVHFEHCRPRHLAAYELLFGAEVHTGQVCNALVFERAVLDVPVHPLGSRAITGVARGRGRARPARPLAVAGDAFCSEVQSVIEAELEAGRLSQTEVAKRFSMTTRTLQRRCRERGFHYRQLVSRARRTVAMRLLHDRSLNIHEIAMAIGYDASSFNRVFRSWTGMSPSAFRKARGGGSLRA